ncbi:acyltransferase 3 [Cupriavidus basilensis OR16]|uniref:Acyltransferase 3 n=2 Tax=Cupriavidus basilensis TaxID=68895 RepID=H1SI25_9BURK|nr:acyltransferase 3 [Cupriavidus basilensis OR16]
MAAIIVLISHVSIFGLYGYEHTLATWPPTRLLWAGHQAVILFFVISGFALYLQFDRMAGIDGRWRKFVLIRVLRLYPPYLGSLLLGLLVLKAPMLLGISVPSGAPVIAHGNLTAETLVGHLLMIIDVDTGAINPPIWTLIFEMRLTLLFPLIHFAIERGGHRSLAVIIAFWIAGVGSFAAYDLHYLPKPDQTIFISIPYTAIYGGYFAVGALVAKHRTLAMAWVSALRKSFLQILLAISIIVFLCGHGYSWPEWVPESLRHIADAFVAVASAFFVAVAIATPAPPKRGLLGFFGAISYSLYLVHQSAVIGTISLFFGRYPAPLLWLISISAAVGLAWLFHVAIERPSHAASRMVRRKIAVGRSMPPASGSQSTG